MQMYIVQMIGVADKIVMGPRIKEITEIAKIPPKPNPQARFISVKEEKIKNRDICQHIIMKHIILIGIMCDSCQIETLSPRESESIKA